MSMTTVVTIRDPRPEWNCSDFADSWPEIKALRGVGHGLRVPQSSPRAIPTGGPGWPSRSPSVRSRA
jgi:hypothetical protein